jgi:hypothetical protein
MLQKIVFTSLLLFATTRSLGFFQGLYHERKMIPEFGNVTYLNLSIKGVMHAQAKFYFKALPNLNVSTNIYFFKLF